MWGLTINNNRLDSELYDIISNILGISVHKPHYVKIIEVILDKKEASYEL
jgi:hypothetical protein